MSVPVDVAAAERHVQVADAERVVLLDEERLVGRQRAAEGILDVAEAWIFVASIYIYRPL